MRTVHGGGQIGAAGARRSATRRPRSATAAIPAASAPPTGTARRPGSGRAEQQSAERAHRRLGAVPPSTMSSTRTPGAYRSATSPTGSSTACADPREQRDVVTSTQAPTSTKRSSARSPCASNAMSGRPAEEQHAAEGRLTPRRGELAEPLPDTSRPAAQRGLASRPSLRNAEVRPPSARGRVPPPRIAAQRQTIWTSTQHDDQRILHAARDVASARPATRTAAPARR